MIFSFLGHQTVKIAMIGTLVLLAIPGITILVTLEAEQTRGS